LDEVGVADTEGHVHGGLLVAFPEGGGDTLKEKEREGGRKGGKEA